METILLTGCAGFIGSAVAEKLLEKKYKVIGIDNFLPNYDINLKKNRLKRFKKNKNFIFIKQDITEFEKFDKKLGKIKINKICHMAAQPGVRDSLTNPFKYEKANSLGMLSVLELAKKRKINHFIFASSSSVYGQSKKTKLTETDKTDYPESVYAATKKHNELQAYVYHKLYGIKCTGLRFFTVYGPWGRPDMAPIIFAKAIQKGKEIKVFNNGKMKRDFTYIDDITDGIIKAIEKNYEYEIINLGRGSPVKLEYFIELLEKNIGKKAKKKYMLMQKGDVFSTYANINKAKKLLNFEPKTNIEKGTKLFIAWFKDYYGE